MRFSRLFRFGRQITRVVAIVALVCGTVLIVSAPSQAGPHGHDGGHWHGGWGWGPWWPGYYYGPYASYPPDYVYPPVYAYPVVPAPPVVIQQPAPAPVPPPVAQQQAPAPTSYYYCKKPKGYYPYVQSCSVSWRLVPLQPNGAVAP